MTKKRIRKPSTKQLSPEYKKLAREANKRLGTKLNTRKKALSQYAVKRAEYLKREGFISGTQYSPTIATIKVPPKIAKQAKASGFQVINGRIAIANIPERKQQLRSAIRKGNIGGVQRIGNIGFEHYVLPSRSRNFHDIIAQIDSGEFDRQLDADPNLSFGFKVFGNHSRVLYQHTGKLREALMHYQARFDLMKKGNDRGKQAEELWENFEIIRLDQEHYKRPEPQPQGRRDKQRKDKIRKRRMENQEKQRIKKWESEAARLKAYRAKISSPETRAKERQRKAAERGGYKRGPRIK